MNYDSAMLEFVGGDNASGGDGVVSLNASGTGTETTLNYTIVFKCLSEGNTVLQSAGSTAYLFRMRHYIYQMFQLILRLQLLEHRNRYWQAVEMDCLKSQECSIQFIMILQTL